MNNNYLNAIAKALMELFKNLFGKKGASPEEFVEESHSAEDFLSKMRDSCIESGNTLEAYIFESQRQSLEVFREQVQKGEIPNADINVSAEDVIKKINDRMNLLKTDDDIKDAFQDYHNHSEDRLFQAKNTCGRAFYQFMDQNNIQSKTTLNNIANIGCDSVLSHMSELPKTPAEEQGLVSEKQDVVSVSRERNRSRNNDKDNAFEPTMEFKP